MESPMVDFESEAVILRSLTEWPRRIDVCRVGPIKA